MNDYESDKFGDMYTGNSTSSMLLHTEMNYTKWAGYWPEDATVEETMHTINCCGQVEIYPEAFTLEPNASKLSHAMDIARGGQFIKIPKHYPENAWYHYVDETCEY